MTDTLHLSLMLFNPERPRNASSTINIVNNHQVCLHRPYDLVQGGGFDVYGCVGRRSSARFCKISPISPLTSLAPPDIFRVWSYLVKYRENTTKMKVLGGNIANCDISDALFRGRYLSNYEVYSLRRLDKRCTNYKVELDLRDGIQLSADRCGMASAANGSILSDDVVLRV